GLATPAAAAAAAAEDSIMPSAAPDGAVAQEGCEEGAPAPLENQQPQAEQQQRQEPKPYQKPKQQQQQQQQGKQSKAKSATPRMVKLEDLEDADGTLFEGVYDNEEQLVNKLMATLQGLSHKQQRLYGIWDGTADGGKRAFIEQWRQRHAERRAMAAAMADPARDPKDRMPLRTSYILKWRKVLFSCPNCWLLPGLCVCGRMRRFTPQRTKVVVHAHHAEWGSASNSGSLLPTSLEGAEILLYGHPEHDQRLRAMLDDPTRTTALLWPGSDSLLPEQLAQLAAERTGGRLTVVALDATWSNARRMQGWFPKGTLTVKLPPESTLKENKLSLLRPVRKYRGDLESGRVSTVEAVASLLYDLEGDEAMYRGLLENLKIKVDACRLQKNRSMVYDTHTPEEPSARRRWKKKQGLAEGQEEEGAAAVDGGVEDGVASQTYDGASDDGEVAEGSR
ncbi:hypothetical protein Agub_g11618, partial [Astrephomene gubernaculifera]